MNTIELFSGTKSFSKVAEKLGHSTLTIDNNPKLLPNITADIIELNMPKVWFDVLWASPPCTGFSVASIGSHWTGGREAYIPKSDTARLGIALVKRTIEIINFYKRINPNLIWFIENPMGVLRKMPFMQSLKRNTVTYCKYGDTRMKPTDIWTNSTWTPRPRCKNGDKCHVAAPRGSRTGTQGLKNAKYRGVIPPNLFIEIFKSINNEGPAPFPSNGLTMQDTTQPTTEIKS